MMLIDLHTHTSFSPDSDEPMKNMIERAIELNLDAYAITDHCEADRFFSRDNYKRPQTDHEYDIYNYNIVYENSVSAICKAKELYPKLNLLCGIEWGQALYDMKATEIMCNDKRLDFVIGSLHELEDMPDFAFIDYSQFDIDNLLRKYFEEIARLCEKPVFDTLAHLTYTLRYIEGEQKIKVDMNRYKDIIAQAFKSLAYNGRALEINTSGLRQGYGKTFPTLDFIKLFKEMGGEIITIGSDSHRACDIGKGIAEGIEIAKQAGFRYCAYFKERKPNFIKL
ncbi:MAG: histidinol-phosphatase HisJ family protein [Oscillospiraceae bacterium]|nr:histidinol-phosphatase HisJ family protein [Oscillospiraceae bacterium]